MSISAPTLDDRTFEDLFEQARALIPRYAPEWTDFNESDPGIALLQLQAFFADQLIYRLNQVPDRNYLKFLELLGITLQSASPAQVDVSFTTSSTTVDAIVPAGTQLATAGGTGGSPVVFSLAQAMNVTAANLTSLQVFDSFAYRDVTTANSATGQGFAPFGPLADPGSALLLGFQSAAAFTQQPITLTVYPLQPQQRPAVEAVLGSSPVPPPASFAYEYWDGASWEPLERQLDETWGFLLQGRLVVRAPTTAVPAALGSVSTSLCWLRVRLMTQAYDVIPQLTQVSLNTATATQAVTITGEVLGGSNGMPNQGPFQTSKTPVLPLAVPITLWRSDGTQITVTSLQLEIDEGSGFDPWQEVQDFYASGPDDPHFTLDRTAGEINFGDGRYGRIPVANAANPTANIVAASYSSGGGSLGNVGAGTVTVLQTLATGIASVTNALAASGGADPETLADAKLRAPSALQSQGRAVTASDFETVALASAAPVARAYALPLTNPNFPGVTVPGAVTVVIVPQVPVVPAPMPSQTTLALVCDQLNHARLITTEAFAVGPTYRSVLVTGEIIAAGNADLRTVETAVQTTIVTWLHPLTGGDDGHGWPFGGTIYASSLFRIVLAVEGVARINDNQLLVVLDGTEQSFCRDVAINSGELISPQTPSLVVTYS